ncbi:MAG: hypothetical protein O2812_02640 [Chloroflexi bacterium]|nr:hypothetical protein [Chloroflexota bacterium]
MEWSTLRTRSHRYAGEVGILRSPPDGAGMRRLKPEEYETPVQETDLARLYEVGDLTDEEWEQVKEFARYVRSRRG